jgi:hypothetical protein
MPKKARLNPRDLATEIIRRTAAAAGNDYSYVVHLSDPPKACERLQLAAARILRRPIAIMPAKCLTVEDWLERYARPA